MAVYGATLYGTETYGYFIPPVYRVDPFIATPTSYSQISISWQRPSGTIAGYRLIKNMFGAPVDQDDGQILLDVTTGWLGGNYVDVNVTPGAYHYYGFYILANAQTNEWVRAALTGCLMINDYNSSTTIQDLIPNFYINAINAVNELVEDPVGNTYLSKFSDVFGWGMDYLRTQYDTYLNVNNPWKVPLNDLYTMAGQFNININPDIHPYTLRKAIFYNATVNQLRGTPSGIATELSALTGWNAIITVGPNMLLNNDQSFFADPYYESWSANITYNVGERVTYGNYFYQCISSANYGHAPTGTSSNNTWWEAILHVSDDTYLLNTSTGYPSTWEILYPDVVNAQPSANALYESIGTVDPLHNTNFAFNSLTGANLSGSTQDIYLRSVARTTADMATTTTTFAPDKYQAMADGIPIPFIGFNQVWDSDQNYQPGAIVTYSNQPFVALRESLNSIPPYASTGSASQDWAPLSFDQRFRLCISAYETASSNGGVFPFVEWYDAGGNYIMRVIARNPTPGSAEIPNQLAFDSFTVGAGNTLSARTTDDGGNSWTQQTGSWSVSPFSTGCVYPTVAGTRSIATVSTGNANAQVGLTFVTEAGGSGTSYDVLTAEDSPLAWWKLADNAGSSTAADSSGNGHTGAAYNVTFGSSSTPIPEDTTASFSKGSTSHVLSAYNPALSAITVEAWIDLDGLSQSGNPRFIANSHTDVDNNGFQLMMSSGEFQFWVGTGSASGNVVGGTVASGGWAYIVGTWDGSTLKLYQNGSLITSGAFSGSLSAGTASGIGIGYNPAYNGDYFSGLIAQCAVYSTALSASDIANRYSAALSQFQSSGLILRFTDTNNYLRADMASLIQCQSGTFTTLGSYSQRCVAGDRLLVTCNGTTITCYRNNAQVLQVTTAFNSTSSVFGIVNESLTAPVGLAGIYQDLYGGSY